MDILRVRNLEKYQHYKRRNPPWVKLYNVTLEDYEFEALPDATKWHAMSLVLLASRLGNRIPADPAWIARHTGSKTHANLSLLIRCKFLEVDAINVLADSGQDAMPEERERERESRGDQDSNKSNSRSKAATNGEPPENWQPVYDYLQKSPGLNHPKLYDWPWWTALEISLEGAPVDVVLLTELSRMDEWIIRNPNRGNKKDWRRFVSNWLNRAAGREQ